MSTRCQIGFYEKNEKRKDKFEALIYRHSDGYPNGEHGVLATILPFLNQFPRRDDIEYCSARLLQYLCAKSEESSKANGYPPKGLTGETGIGICIGFHGDIEYLYKVFPSRVEVCGPYGSIIKAISVS